MPFPKNQQKFVSIETEERMTFRLRPSLALNAKQYRGLQKLFESGLYGNTEGEVLRRIIDAYLVALEDRSQ